MESYIGYNVWGGKNAENPATFEGKSYGIISISGILYMWVSPGSNTTGYTEARLHLSTDHGASWMTANWAFVKDEGLIFPTFAQYGKDYTGARDSYVYIYANHLKNDAKLGIQIPGEIALIRVPRDSLMDRATYEFFSGFDQLQNPMWDKNVINRQPVFNNVIGGVGWNTSVSFNSGLGKYILITEHTESFKGNIGIFEAPEPWGPWKTILYDMAFGNPVISSSTFFWNFSNKWLSSDGRDFVLVFTGVGSNDSWNTIRGSFVIGSNLDTTPPDPPTGVQVDK